MTRLRLLTLSLGAIILSLAFCMSAAGGPPKGFGLRTLVNGLDEPTAFAAAPDGRIYIAEKAGVVRVFDHGRVTIFLDLRDEVNHFSDRGLLNIALDPGFARNRKLYLFYTKELRPNDPDKLHPAGGRLVSLRVSATNPDLAEASSQRTLLSGFDSRGPWHSVAGLTFDRSGRLLAGFGDGTPYYPKESGPSAFRTFDLDSLSGKIVRIDPATGRGVPGNPFYDSSAPDAVRSKVLAFGFRNPYSFQVDPKTDEVIVGDVGTFLWEEIDVVPATWSAPTTQLNFGWPCYEGGNGEPSRQDAFAKEPLCVSRFYDREAAGKPTTVAPLYAYGGKGGAAIVVGPFYRGRAYPEKYNGRLFFADYVKDQFWTLKQGDVSKFGGKGGWGNAVHMQVLPSGVLAYVGFQSGQLNEIAYVGGEDSGGISPLVWIVVGSLVAALLVAGLWFGRRVVMR